MREPRVVRDGTLLDLTVAGQLGAPLDAQLDVAGRPEGDGIPIVAEITTMLCSTQQSGVRRGADGFPVLKGRPTDMDQQPLVALIFL
jgi:hypothetical protein